MRIDEILTEKELNELKIVDRLLHSRSLRTGERIFKRLVHQGMNQDKARHEASQMANVGERELQEYLKDHDLLST